MVFGQENEIKMDGRILLMLENMRIIEERKPH
jgi:hypothetical protein